MSLHPQILKTLLQQQASIADLQENTQVSLPTLRKALQELTDERWIRIVGQADTNGGRPAMLFGLDDSHFLLIGLHLQLPGVRLVTADLAGNVVHIEEAYAGKVPRPDQVIQLVTRYFATIQAEFPDREVIGVGVATPGFTHQTTGDIISIGRVKGWQNVPICQRLTEALVIPVHIANDVDCMAFAEFQHTGTALEQNLIYLGFEQSVKASMFLNGQIYKGSFGNTGLITPSMLNLERHVTPADYQQLLSVDGINRLFDARVQSSSSDVQIDYTKIQAATNSHEKLYLILEGAAEGLPICQDVVQLLTTMLAVATANLIYIIQPDKVVLGGWLGTMPDPLYTRLEETIRGHLSPLFANASVIQQASFASPNLAALGAIYHFLQEYFSTAQPTRS